MARAHSIYVVTLNTHVIKAFTVRHECVRWLGHEYPKVPTNLRVLKIKDGVWSEGTMDITATMFGLAD